MTASAPPLQQLNGPLWPLTLRLSIPSILGFFLYGLNTLLDGFFVGAFLGADAFSALTIAFPVTQILNGFGLVVGVGAASLLSMAIGANEKGVIGRVLGNILALSVLLGAVLTVVGLSTSTHLIAWVNVSEAVREQAVAYLDAMFCGSAVQIAATGFNLVLRGEGRMVHAMSLMGVTTVFHAALTYLSVTQTDFGIAGAGWATNLAFLLSLLLHAVLYRTGRLSNVIPARFRFNLSSGGEICRLGFPSILLNVMQLAQQMLLLAIIGRIGTDADIAFFGALNRIMMFAVMPVFGMSRAMQPIVGVAFGNDDEQRIRQAFQVFTLTGTVLMVSIAAVVAANHRTLMDYMLPGLEMNASELRQYWVYVASMVFLPTLFFSLTLVQSIGRSGLATVLIVLRQVALFAPVTIVLTAVHRLDGLYASFFVVDLLMVVFSAFVLRNMNLTGRHHARPE